MSVTFDYKSGVLSHISVHDPAAIRVNRLPRVISVEAVTGDGMLVSLFLTEAMAILVRDGVATALSSEGGAS